MGKSNGTKSGYVRVVGYQKRNIVFTLSSIVVLLRKILGKKFREMSLYIAWLSSFPKILQNAVPFVAGSFREELVSEFFIE